LSIKILNFVTNHSNDKDYEGHLIITRSRSSARSRSNNYTCVSLKRSCQRF